uniref:(northern house mosquito) hypothetical protein n=1 Tax=Culex pipiens TaxID=7175 RepID=A0A8D8ME86_CULPI
MAGGVPGPIQLLPADVAQQQPAVAFHVGGRATPGVTSAVICAQETLVNRSQNGFTVRARFHPQQGQRYKFLIAPEYQSQTADDGVRFVLELGTTRTGVGRIVRGTLLQQQIAFALDEIGQCVDVDVIALDFQRGYNLTQLTVMVD